MSSIVFYKNSKYSYKHSFLLIGIILFLGIAFRSIIDIRMSSLDEFIYLLLISVYIQFRTKVMLFCEIDKKTRNLLYLCTAKE